MASLMIREHDALFISCLISRLASEPFGGASLGFTAVNRKCGPASSFAHVEAEAVIKTVISAFDIKRVHIATVDNSPIHGRPKDEMRQR